MENTVTSISFSIFSNKGVYALLLGSGISKNAGIPTGWDIVQDMIEKLAILKKEEFPTTPQEWFEKKYGIEANYSTILGKLAKTPNERLNLLKPYFESRSEKLEPSNAHKNIAKLVRSGYIKVIITTNFDRLTENALREEGIEPTIIKHPDDIKGATPLVHNQFTLIKVNGDYLDSRFLNTEIELSSYDSALQNYLLQIFNDFGVISVGWSAKWDTGLIEILRKTENFRYSSYWTYLGNCEKELEEIAKFRKGETHSIKNADSFFYEISEKISALEKINNEHPLTADIAVAQIKKYISKDEFKIQLHDMFLQQLVIVNEKLKRLHSTYSFADFNHLKTLLSEYSGSMSILIPMITNSVLWAKQEHYYLFAKILSRLHIPSYNGIRYFNGTEDFRLFPTLIAFYTIGITSVHTEKFEILASCFNLKVDKDESPSSEQYFMIERVNPCHGVVENNIMNANILNKGYKTPTSTYLNQLLRPYFKTEIPSDREYETAFDLFEYLISLNYEHLCSSAINDFWAPYGEYKWRYLRITENPITKFMEEADKYKNDWPPIKVGMFNGDYQTFIQVKNRLQEHLSRIFLY